MGHTTTLDDRAVPSHRCTICGAMWRVLTPKDFGGACQWTLVSPFCGACCDNAPMSDQIKMLTIGELKQWLFNVENTNISTLPPKLQEECARLDQAVYTFAQHMKDKLHKKAVQGFTGWDDTAFEPIIKGKFIERAHRLHEGDTSQAVDVANLAMMLFTQALDSYCICFNCAAAGHNGGDEQCACDGIPVYDAVRCGTCKHKAACDVALNPQLYPDATRGEETQP